ncbi:MAG: 30S ribosomal protein S18 [Candidatus Omnitrophota bacterium]
MMKVFVPPGTDISYKNPDFLKKFLTDRGKMLARRLTGVTAEEQRQISISIKQARYLGLLSVGSSKRR